MPLAGLDLWLLRLLNEWVARSPSAFLDALSQSNQLPWLLAAATLVALWFAGRSTTAETADEVAAGGVLTRQAARRRVILLLVALLLAFLSARVLQIPFHRLRPLAETPLPILVPIDPATWAQVRSGLLKQGSFPSDHAVMFFALVAGVFAINRWWGIVALVAALYFSALRIGVGFHYPSDFLGGLILALGLGVPALLLERPLKSPLNSVLAAIEAYPWVAYPAAFLFLFDFTQKFSSLFAFLTRPG